MTIGRSRGTSLKEAATHLIAASRRPNRTEYIALLFEATPAGDQSLLDEETCEKLWQLYRQGLVGLPQAATAPPASVERFLSLVTDEGTAPSKKTKA